MKTFTIKRNSILLPNMIGKVTGETPATITLKVTKLNFGPKTSITGLTHKFSRIDQLRFKTFKGREIRFWKSTGKQVGSSYSGILGKMFIDF